MNELFNLFLFTLGYYQLDNILKSYVYNKFELFLEAPIIFYPIIQSANIFMLTIFTSFTTYLLCFSKIRNNTMYSLSFIYIKYIMDTIIYHNTISKYEYEFRKILMWLFTTPLMLKLYCDINNLRMLDINYHYHVISVILQILTFLLHKEDYYIYIVAFLSLLESYFIYKLCHFKEQKYTKLIIFIWCLISLIEITNLFNIYDINICYLFSDMIAKLTTIIIVNDYDEQMYHIKNNIDLQSISLLTVIKKSIKQFENTTNITEKCKKMIEQLDNKVLNLIPNDKTSLKLELLKKILPLELEDKYLMHSKEYKPYDFICVLFTDIVSYTELAKKYDADIIYKLLNEIYTNFDDVVNHYPNLQKIETIGDAYMVVGDIYTNDTQNNIKNIILLAHDFLREIKKIKTPNNIPLELRIGINIGKVVVGILGVEIPRLCVIGNTVNVANRLQTTAEPNTIQISRHVYEFAETIDFGIDVKFELKENVYLKNLGTTNTYIIIPKL